MATINRAFTERHMGADLEFTALSTSGVAVDFTGKDDKTAIIIQNTGSGEGKVTVVAGTGIQGVTDIEIAVPASGFKAIRLDSGEFKQTSGTDKGCVILKGATTLKAAVVELVE